MQNRYKAFTLVELMVAMAIIAVLIGMSVFGISTAQRVLRDNQRRDAVKNMAAGLNAYYTTASTYPATLASSNGGTQLVIGNEQPVPLTGIMKAGTATDSTQTRYCYAFDTTTLGGYKLGVQLEDGTWFNLGSANTLCSNSDAPVP